MLKSPKCSPFLEPYWSPIGALLLASLRAPEKFTLIGSACWRPLEGNEAVCLLIFWATKNFLLQSNTIIGKNTITIMVFFGHFMVKLYLNNTF